MTDKIRAIKPAESTLDDDQKELVSAIRELLNKALAGELKGLFGIVSIVDDGEDVHDAVLVGIPADVSDLYRRLGHLQHLIDRLDGTSWVQSEEEDEEG